MEILPTQPLPEPYTTLTRTLTNLALCVSPTTHENKEPQPQLPPSKSWENEGKRRTNEVSIACVHTMPCLPLSPTN